MKFVHFKVLKSSDVDLEIYHIWDTDKFIILMILFFTCMVYNPFLGIICNL